MLALERPSGGPALQALVAPARSTDPLGLHDDRIAALVFISDPADEQKPSEQLLRELYGLTPAEASVAARIAVGWSLERIAAERGSALETVRRQSKQILAKTGARHRSELVVRLLTLFPGIQG
jgi:DNA-binding NarL/FixJ family response regulator